MREQIGIYIHVPFCLSKCRYCDFYSIPVSGDFSGEDDYCRAVLNQLERDLEGFNLQGRGVGSIYFGGGTPSIMSPKFFSRILDRISNYFSVLPDVEITCEANPATVNMRWFADMKRAGFNRISIGVQSFNERNLKLLGRAHGASDAMTSIAEAQDSGFENLSVDLIYSIPGSSIADLEEDLRLLMTFNPAHISAYSLAVEDGTPLYRMVDAGELVMPSEEDQLKQMRILSRMLGRVGWRRYEISNYSKSGMESRHNLNYWRYGEYLGLGSSAASFIRDIEGSFGVRRSIAPSAESYMRGEFLQSDEKIDEMQGALEFMFMGLRMIDGISLSNFRAIFGRGIEEFYSDKINSLLEKGLLVKDGDSMALSPGGLEISNQIFAEFAL